MNPEQREELARQSREIDRIVKQTFVISAIAIVLSIVGLIIAVSR